MVPLSINELTTLRWSFEEDVLNCRAAGVSALGVWRPKLADYGEERGIELLAEHGIAVSNLLWAGGFTEREPSTFKEMLADAEEAIELAARLEAGCLVLYSGGRAGHTAKHARRIFRDALKHLDPIAAASGVTLAVEPMHEAIAEPFTVLTSLEVTLETIAAANCRSTKLVFDTYHMGHGNVPLAKIAEVASRVAIVHLADARGAPGDEQNRCRLGNGSLPLGDLIAALVAGGYRGYYDIELFGQDVEWFDYAELIAHSQRAFNRLGVPAEPTVNVKAAVPPTRNASDNCNFERRTVGDLS
jgi:sugar phosphate isomerase/epimerase